MRNTDPPRVTITRNTLDPLFNDSDRRLDKLLLWQAERLWQSWFISAYSRVTGARQTLRRESDNMRPSEAQQLLLSTSLLYIKKARVMVASPNGWNGCESLEVGVQSATSGLSILKQEDFTFGYLELWVVVEVRNDWSVSALSVPAPAPLLLRRSHGQLAPELEPQSQIW